MSYQNCKIKSVYYKGEFNNYKYLIKWRLQETSNKLMKLNQELKRQVMSGLSEL